MQTVLPETRRRIQQSVKEGRDRLRTHLTVMLITRAQPLKRSLYPALQRPDIKDERVHQGQLVVVAQVFHLAHHGRHPSQRVTTSVLLLAQIITKESCFNYYGVIKLKHSKKGKRK